MVSPATEMPGTSEEHKIRYKDLCTVHAAVKSTSNKMFWVWFVCFPHFFSQKLTALLVWYTNMSEITCKK